MTRQPSLFDDDQDPEAARALGESAAADCADAAERRGWDAAAARALVVQLLRERGPMAGEVLVSAAARIHPPHDARAFGQVFLQLKRAGLIEVCGHTKRLKGHNTGGGNIWRLVEGKR